MGYYEDEKFAIGSARIAMAIAQNTAAISIVGGGDTADFALKWDGHDGANFTHVSTGGGASMELMSGKKLVRWSPSPNRNEKEPAETPPQISDTQHFLSFSSRGVTLRKKGRFPSPRLPQCNEPEYPSSYSHQGPY